MMWRVAAATGLLVAGPMVAGGPDHPGPALDLQSLLDAARPGEVLALPPGTYRGGAVIDKPLTLVGSPEVVIDAGGTGSGLVVTSPDVALARLEIRHTGSSLDAEDAAVSAEGAARLLIEDCVFEDVLFGVFLRLSPDSVIRQNTIGAQDLDPGRRGDAFRLWESHGTVLEGNRVDGGRDSVIFFSDDVVVRGNRITNGRYGLHLMYASRATIEENLLEGNSVGVYIMYSSDVVFSRNVVLGSQGPSGYGLGLKDVDNTIARDNRLVANRVGIYLDNSPISAAASQDFIGNLIANNRVGVLFTASVERNRFTRNAFVQNDDQVGIAGTGRLEGNTWTVDGVGNHWDDFRGYDADGDGVGDVAYRLDEVYSVLIDRHPELALFTGTPAARAIDLTGRVFPGIRPVPKVVDDAPLVARPALPDSYLLPTPPGRLPLWFASASMVILAVAIVAGAWPARRS